MDIKYADATTVCARPEIRSRKTVFTLLALFIASCGPASGQDAMTPILDHGEAGWTAKVLADGLDYPWDIVRDGERLILTEKSGSIVMIEGGEINRLAFQTSSPLRIGGGAGLLGIALAPDFATSGRAFFYYSYEGRSGPENRVVSAVLDGGAWRETQILIDAIPGHRLYNGGRIAIGPDGHLYATTGWTENYERPQDLGNLAGKVLRVALSGAVPDDNPFPGSLVYSLGHRNPQGLAWDAEGQLYIAEHGQSARDEINIIQPGSNYGWPLVSGDETSAGLEAPVVHSGRSTWAPSGIAFASNELLVTGLVSRGLLVLDRAAGTMRAVHGPHERYRQVLPDGDDLLVITTNRSPRGSGPSPDSLIRLSPSR